MAQGMEQRLNVQARESAALIEEARARHGQLQQEVERLQKQLKEQSEAFELERAQWTQQRADAGGRNMRGLKSALLRAVPHLRSQLEEADLELGGTDVRPQHTGTTDQGVRESGGDECCGKTFSSAGLRQALRRTSRCPFCRVPRLKFSPNRDVAALVELHHAERSALGLPELRAPSSDEVVELALPISDATCSHHSRSSTSSRQSRLREQRVERVNSRSSLFRPRSAVFQSQPREQMPAASRNIKGAAVIAIQRTVPRDRQELVGSERSARVSSRRTEFIRSAAAVEGEQNPRTGQHQEIGARADDAGLIQLA